MNELHVLLLKVSARLCGMNEEDLTTAERQIAKLLIEAEYLGFDDNRDLHLTNGG